MNFEFIKGHHQLQSLYTACSDAEDLVVIKPSMSVTSARSAMEYLVKMIYSTAVSNDIRGLTVYEMLCDNRFTAYVDDQELLDAFHKIRIAGNKAVHEGNASGTAAREVLAALHYAVGEICIFLGLIETYPPFDPNVVSNTEKKDRQTQLELDISQDFVSEVRERLAGTSHFSEARKLVDVHIRTKNKNSDIKNVDSAANSKTALYDVCCILRTELTDYDIFADRLKCTVAICKENGKQLVLAVKSGCPPLGTKRNGQMQILPDIDLVLYAPDFELNKSAISQLRVFTKDAFLQMWTDLGLIRAKVSNAALSELRRIHGADYKSDKEKDADILAVQSFQNSGKKKPLVYSKCEQQPSFEMQGIQIIKNTLNG